MNMRADCSGIGRFFYDVQKRIICILGGSYVKLAGKIRGGFAYWRGGVFGGVGGAGLQGVNAEKGGSAGACVGAKALQVNGFAHSLPGDAKGSGAGGGAAVAPEKCVNDGVSHGGISKARQRVVVYAQSPDGCQLLVACIWQCCAGRPYRGQSVFSITLAGA